MFSYLLFKYLEDPRDFIFATDRSRKCWIVSFFNAQNRRSK